jgi:hypothetical protein
MPETPMTEMSMPDTLQRAVTALSLDLRQIATDNWIDIGEDGRDAYCRYLDRAWTARGLSKRRQLAGLQLCYPSVGNDGSTAAGFVGAPTSWAPTSATVSKQILAAAGRKPLLPLDFALIGLPLPVDSRAEDRTPTRAVTA